MKKIKEIDIKIEFRILCKDNKRRQTSNHPSMNPDNKLKIMILKILLRLPNRVDPLTDYDVDISSVCNSIPIRLTIRF